MKLWLTYGQMDTVTFYKQISIPVNIGISPTKPHQNNEWRTTLISTQIMITLTHTNDKEVTLTLYMSGDGIKFN